MKTSLVDTEQQEVLKCQRDGKSRILLGCSVHKIRGTSLPVLPNDCQEVPTSAQIRFNFVSLEGVL